MRPRAFAFLLTLACSTGGVVSAEQPATAGQHGGITHGVAVVSSGYLGVDLGDDKPVNGRAAVHGAEIVRVDHDGPAGKVGLREHDIVIQMNGVAVESGEQIRRMLHEVPPGRAITLIITRDGQQLSLSPQMADRYEVEREAWDQHFGPAVVTTPPGPQAPANALPTGEVSSAGSSSGLSNPTPSTRYGKSFLGTLLLSPTYTGLVLEKMGPQLAGFFGVTGGSGALIKSVAENSPAAMAGLRAGDVVVRADQLTVATPAAFTKAIREAKGHPIAVTVVRDRQEKTFTLTPDTKRRSAIDLRLPDASETTTVARLTEF